MISSSRKYAILSYILAALVMIYGSYMLPRLLPGDFVTAMYSGAHVAMSAEQEEALKTGYAGEEGFGRYLLDLVRLDWGTSYAFAEPIAGLIVGALPWTLLLMGGAHVLSMLTGFVAGVEAAWRRGGKTEKACVGTMTILQGIPELAAGVILLWVFSLHLGWFPASGAELAYANHSAAARMISVAHHLTLPFATLFLAWFPGNFLLARGSMVMVLQQQYLETARAKGLPPVRVRYAHGARNAMMPMVTRFGLRLAFMLIGVLVVETIYSYPGIGTLLFNAISMRDLPLVQRIVLLSSLLVLFINLALEIVYGLLDPRVNHAS